jgi:CysZ protein
MNMTLIALTFRTLLKANLLRLMIACAVIGVVAATVLVAAVTGLAASLVHFKTGWLNTAFDWGTGIVLGIGGWFMLPVLTILIGGIFQETVIARVEQAYYPDSARTQSPRFWPDFVHDIQFTAKALLLNLLALPAYFFGIGFLISILLNSYLLGREFFEAAAGYHIGKTKARELGRRRSRIVYGGGLAMTLLTLTPVINVFVPIIAVVWMVHGYHRVKHLNTV